MVYMSMVQDHGRAWSKTINNYGVDWSINALSVLGILSIFLKRTFAQVDNHKMAKNAFIQFLTRSCVCPI